MGCQNKNMYCSDLQNNILDLEKKYFWKIQELINDPEFFKSLLLSEEQIQVDYYNLKKIWNSKNIFKIPAERLMQYYVHEKFDFIEGYYPSPISSDIGIVTSDAIINIDVKTIDVVGNSGDINTIQFEHNQISFKNKNLYESGLFKGFPIKSNIPSIDTYTGLPILTYIVKFIYSDDGNSFSLYRGDGYYTISIACIPNGELSEIFDYDLVTNFKDYKYYNSTSGEYYTPKKIISESNKPHNFLQCDIFYDIVESNIQIDPSWSKIFVGNRPGYYDPKNDVPWVVVRKGNSKENYVYYLYAVKEGNTARICTDYIRERYDSSGQLWYGYVKFRI